MLPCDAGTVFTAVLIFPAQFRIPHSEFRIKKSRPTGRLFLFVVQPGFRFRGGNAFDVFLFVRRGFAAVGVEEVVALRGLIQRFLIARRIAVHAAGALFDQRRSLGVVLSFGNDFFPSL